MSLTPDFIDNCQGHRILIVNPFYTTPVVEMGMEIAEVLCERNVVVYVGPDALRCVTDYSVKFPSRLWIYLSRKRHVSRYLSNKVRSYTRPEIEALVGRLEVPSAEALLDLADPDLKARRFENFDIGMGIVSSLVSLTRDSRVDPSQYRDYAMALANDALKLYRLTGELVRTNQSDIVLLFNGRQAAVRGVRRACEALGVRYITYERGSSRERYALFDRATPHHPERLREWVDNWWAVAQQPETVARNYLDKRRAGRSPGWYSFTRKQEHGLCPPRDGRTRVTFFTSSEDELVAVGDELAADSPLCNQAHSIRAVGLACRERGFEYLVRFHPNTPASERALFASAQEAGAQVLEPANRVDTYALLDSSDIVFTHNSTVGIEAASVGKPAYYVGRNYFERCRSVRRLKQEREIAEALDAPKAPDPLDALKYAHFSASHGIAHRYYQPRGFYSGSYRGRDLNGPFLSALRDAKLRLTRGGI